jgi:hypothetical protein
MNVVESRPDRGFRRAMGCGFVGYLASVLAWAVAGGGMPPPELRGRLFFVCLAPAAITGLVARGRYWSRARVVAVYAATAVVLLAVAAVPRLTAGR